jgi:hypothetical protein
VGVTGLSLLEKIIMLLKVKKSVICSDAVLCTALSRGCGEIGIIEIGIFLV